VVGVEEKKGTSKHKLPDTSPNTQAHTTMSRVIKKLPTKNNKRKRIPIDDQVDSSSSSGSDASDDEEDVSKQQTTMSLPSAIPNGTGKAPRIPKTEAGLAKGKRLILFLDQAKLETIKTSHGYALLNCDEHRHLHKRYKRDPADSRPDVRTFPASLFSLVERPRATVVVRGGGDGGLFVWGLCNYVY
jgi:hypothetical protein